jgi:hypothetical protein
MKNLTQAELIALGGVLKLECLGLAVSRALKPLVDDEDLKRITEAGILAQEGRIQSIKKFINENVTNNDEGGL